MVETGFTWNDNYSRDNENEIGRIQKISDFIAKFIWKKTNSSGRFLL